MHQPPGARMQHSRAALDQVAKPETGEVLVCLFSHPRPAVAEAAISIAMAGAVHVHPAPSLDRAVALQTLAHELVKLVDPTAPAATLKARSSLRHAVLAAMNQLLTASGDAAEVSEAQFEALVRAVRWIDRPTRLLAAACVSHVIATPRFPALVAALPASVTLPRPFGAPPAVETGADSGDAPMEVDDSAHMLALRAHSLILPVLIQLLDEQDDVSRQVPAVLERVIAGRPVLQRTVADSNALESLASSIAAQVRSHTSLRGRAQKAVGRLAISCTCRACCAGREYARSGKRCRGVYRRRSGCSGGSGSITAGHARRHCGTQRTAGCAALR